jgi:hypothetical protein
MYKNRIMEVSMTLKHYKRGWDGETVYILCTDCAGDQGMETAWNQVTKVINDGCKAEDIEKMVTKLTRKPDSYSYEHYLRVGIRAAERYCLGKMLTGETEETIRNSHRWDPLKKAIPKEFFEHFSINEVKHRLDEYFISFASIHNALKSDIKSVIFYGPGLFKYPSDMSKAEMLQAAAANPYYIPAYIKGMELRRKDFENKVASVDLTKYHGDNKDAQRVHYAIVSKDRKAHNGLLKITDPKKALVRYIMGLKAGEDWYFLKDEALKTIPDYIVEAYCRQYAGLKMSTYGLLPKAAAKVKETYRTIIGSRTCPATADELLF